MKDVIRKELTTILLVGAAIGILLNLLVFLALMSAMY